MGKKGKRDKAVTAASTARPSALLDTRVIYCGDCLEQLKNLPDACVDLIYIDPPLNFASATAAWPLDVSTASEYNLGRGADNGSC